VAAVAELHKVSGLIDLGSERSESGKGREGLLVIVAGDMCEELSDKLNISHR